MMNHTIRILTFNPYFPFFSSSTELEKKGKYGLKVRLEKAFGQFF